MNPGPPSPAGGATRLLHRAARVPLPRLPSGQITVAAPPVPPPNNFSSTMLTLLLPLLSTVAMAGYMISFGRRWLVVAGIAFVIVSVVATFAMRYQMGSSAHRQRIRVAQRYRRHLAQTRREARTVAATQRAAATVAHPSPLRLLGIVQGGRRVWERRPTDQDFLQIRVGLGRAPLCTPVGLASRTDPMVEADPELAAAAAETVAAAGTVGRQPALIDVGRAGVVSVVASPEAARGVGRAVVLQVATLHAPEDVAVAICAPGAADVWDWAKWLPHVRTGGPAGADAIAPGAAADGQDAPPGPVAIAADLEALTDLLEPWLARARAITEARPVGGRTPADPGRRLILLVDGYDPGGDWVREPVLRELLARAGPQAGVSVVCLVTATALQPPRAEVRLVVDDDGRIELTGSGPLLAVTDGVSDAPGVALAECVARALAALRLRPSGSRQLVETLSVPQLLGLSSSELAGTGRWLPAGSPELLRVPIGVDLDGTPVILDLKEAAQDGMGPHGLVVGATGSGKSELLRTLVLGLATTQSPDLLNFVLVDFKGGATFANLVDLPHVAGLITNLADDMALVARVRLALQGEQQRRQRLLREAGNVDSVREYQVRHAAGDTDVQGRPLPPLPYLLVIVDEFGELLAGRPDFIELFVQIGRVGRSLGIHLLLASQRLDEGRLRGLESHLSYRIGLRTFSAAESRAVLGTPDAYLLPPLPGSAYLKVDESMYRRFRVSHVSGPAWPAAPAEVAPLGVLPFAPRTVTEPAPAGPVDTGVAPAPSTMDIVVSGLAGTGAVAHQVWLPPLPAAVALGAIVGPVVATSERGVQAVAWPWPGSLRVPIGVQDLPLDQQQSALVIDFATAGNLAAVGAPQTGKSTLLRTAILATMLTHTPDEAQFACVDFGGGGLRAVASAPHVAGVAGRRDPELVRRVLLDTRRLVDERERLFAEWQVDSPAQWRRRRAAGELPPGTRAADVFLVLDNWPALRSEVDLADEVVVDIAARGLGVAVHVILTANRWLDVRPNLRDSITTRLELRLNDPAESEVGRIAARGLVDAAPGRGIAPPGVMFQAVLPRIDGIDSIDGLAEAQEDALSKLTAGWAGPAAPEIRTLPRQVARSGLLVDPGAPGVPIGLDEVGLAPVALDLEADDQHLLVLGDSGCGKTQFLRSYLAGLARRYPSDRLRFVLLDYRRSLLGAVADDYIGAYAADPVTGREYVAQLDARLAERMAPPGLDGASRVRAPHWDGPEIYLVVDDYDVAGGTSSPLLPLLDRLVHAPDLGFHLVLARRVTGCGRAFVADQFLARARELQPAGLIMSGDPREGILLGEHRAAVVPPGRGTLIRRGHPATVVQIAINGD